MRDEALRVHVSRYIAQPAARVFDAWLSPDLIGKWMFGPIVRDEQVLHIRLDARVGGSFSFLVRRDDQEIDHVGEYIEIRRPERLAFTWAIGQSSIDSARVEVDIVRRDGGCNVQLVHWLDPDWANQAGRIEAAWRKMLAALDARLHEHKGKSGQNMSHDSASG